MNGQAPDFESAAIFLEQAKVAWQEGDKRGCESAIYLLAVAVGINNGPRVNSHHLKSDAR